MYLLRSCLGIWDCWPSKSRTTTDSCQVLLGSLFYPPLRSGDGGTWVFRVDYNQPITVNSLEGWQVNTAMIFKIWQVCLAASVELCDHLVGWKDISATSLDSQSIHLDLTSECSTSTCSGLAYLWRETPCLTALSCPIYATATGNLPATPWIWHL